MRLTAAEIATRAGGEIVAGDPGVVVTSWGFDSRALAPGACFVALRPITAMGTTSSATRSAAVCTWHSSNGSVPFSSRPGHPHALVRVPNVLRGLQDVARSVRRERADLVVIGVTGSTGKTSTKDLLAAALPPGEAFASPESYNNEFGLPITLLNAPAPAHVVVAEMGERFPGDVAFLCEIAQPQFGVVTNVGLAHAEHLGGPEGIAGVLAELVEAAACARRRRCSTPTTRGHRGCGIAARRPSRPSAFAPDADASDHRCRGRHRPASRRSPSPAAASAVGLRGAAPGAQRGDGRGGGATSRSAWRSARDRGAHRRRRVGRAGAWSSLESPDGVRRAQRFLQREPGVDGGGVARARAPGGRRAPHRGARRHARARCAQCRRARGGRSPRAWSSGSTSLIGVGDGRRRRSRPRRDGAGRSSVDTVADAEDCGRRIVASHREAGDAVLVKASRALGLAGRRRAPAPAGGDRVIARPTQEAIA